MGARLARASPAPAIAEVAVGRQLRVGDAGRATAPPVRRGLAVVPSGVRCARCLQPICICARIPEVPTRTRVVVLRHFSEMHRSSNSGRLAHLALPNSEIVDHAVPGAPLDPARLAQPGAWIVFPEGEPWTQAPSPAPARIIVIDATWAQARRMRQRVPGLRGLPVLRLPDAAAPAARLRAAPAPGMVSTIEAIARALRLLEGDAPADALEQLFALVVEQARALGRPLPA